MARLINVQVDDLFFELNPDEKGGLLKKEILFKLTLMSAAIKMAIQYKIW